MSRNVLIAGALGVVGRAMLREFERHGGWQVTGLARRGQPPDMDTRILALDLRDADACQRVVEQAAPFTHLVFCANYEKPNLVRGWLDLDHVEINAAMLRNLMEALLRTSPDLQHVTVLQGTKAYGAAAGFFKLPAKEDDPRYPAPNFYYAQEDYLRQRQKGTAWRWTALRPQFVCGFALESPMNGLTAIGVYAAICRELEMPLRYPGGPLRVQEATDSRLLAKAAYWAATTPACADQIFNIVNGDVFTWESLWPKIAKVFDMEVAPPAPSRLKRVMAGKDAVWDRIVEKHGLKPYRLTQLVPNWEMADNLLGLGIEPRPLLLSGIKARRFGFHDCIDSEDMFVEWLRYHQSERILPEYREAAA
jgi:nucleoside-diphosphate-sugar epimerase